MIDAKKVEFPLKREMKLVMAVYCGHRHGGEEKTVTIRGIDKNYYEQFVRLTKIWVEITALLSVERFVTTVKIIRFDLFHRS